MTTRNQRLETEANVWFACVRPDGRPHLTPIWFVWVDGSIWLCTQTNAVKVRNIRANPNVSIALEDGNAPVTGEGRAMLHPQPDLPSAVRAAFIAKYEWDVVEPDNILIEIAITKWLQPSNTADVT